MKSNLLSSFFSFSLGPWAAAVISFLVTPVTTWLIIPTEFGKASMFTLAYGFIIQVALLGTDQSFVRSFYEKGEGSRDSLLWQCILPPLALSFLFALLILFFRKEVSLVLFDSADHALPVAIFSITIITGVLDRFAALALRMKKRGMAFSSLRIVNVSVSSLVLISYAFFVSRSFHAVLVGTLAGNIGSLTLAFALEKGLWKPHGGSFGLREIGPLIRYGIPFVPTFLVVWVFQSMDRMALRYYSTFTEIGLYSAAFKLVSALTLLQASFTMFWTPHAYEEYERSPDSTELFEKMFVAISFTMLLLASLAILSKDLVILILARSYHDAVFIMPFLIFQPLMYTVSEVTVCGINFKRQTYWHFWISVICALFNLAGNFLLVPAYGARGAALSTGISYILFFFLRTSISRRCHPVPYRLRRFYLLTALVCAQAFVNTFSQSLAFQVSVSLLATTAIAGAYRKEIRTWGTPVVSRLFAKTGKESYRP